MQNYLSWAAALSVLIGVVHSVLGEVLIFRRLRRGSLIPTHAPPPLAERHIRILWATWHVVTVFGFAFATILYKLGSAVTASSLQTVVLAATGAAFLGSAILVFVGTKGRHPGWVGLVGAAALVALAARVA
ncbi:MAG: hypothetical protein ABIR16_04645 [Dokdonella sp.]